MYVQVQDEERKKKKTFVNKVRIRLAKTVEAFFFFLACVCGYPSDAGRASLDIL